MQVIRPKIHCYPLHPVPSRSLSKGSWRVLAAIGIGILMLLLILSSPLRQAESALPLNNVAQLGQTSKVITLHGETGEMLVGEFSATAFAKESEMALLRRQALNLSLQQHAKR